MSHRSSQTTHLQLIYGAWRTQSIFEKGDLTGLRCADTTGSTTGSTAVGALKKLDQLKEAGFELTVSDARGLGFTLREIKEAGHTPEKVGESRDSRDQGDGEGRRYTAGELRQAGYEDEPVGKILKTYKEDGSFSWEDAKKLGFLFKDLKNAGFELTASEARGFGLTLREIKEAGYTPDEVGESRDSRDQGDGEGRRYTAGELRQAGYEDDLVGEILKKYKEDNTLSWVDAKKYGFSCKDFKNAGYDCKEANKAGWSCNEVEEAGYSRKDTIAAGYSNSERLACGIDEGTNLAGF